VAPALINRYARHPQERQVQAVASARTFISGAYTTGNSPIENPDRFNIDGTGFSGSNKSTNPSKEQSPIETLPELKA